MKGAGGTAGGLVSFGLGLLMALGGGYLLTQRVTASSGLRSWMGPHPSGFSLLPILIGAGLLFFDGKSRPGWVLIAGGVAMVLLGVLANPRIYLEPTRLFDTLIVLVLLAGGIGLVAGSLRPQSPSEPPAA